MSHNGYEVKFTMQVPAGIDLDLFDQWCDLMVAIIDFDDRIKFRKELRSAGDDHWKLYDTEVSYAINCEGEFYAHFEGEKLVKVAANKTLPLPFNLKFSIVP